MAPLGHSDLSFPIWSFRHNWDASFTCVPFENCSIYRFILSGRHLVSALKRHFEYKRNVSILMWVGKHHVPCNIKEITLASSALQCHDQTVKQRWFLMRYTLTIYFIHIQWNLSITTTEWDTYLPSGAHLGGHGPPRWAPEGRNC